MPFPLDELTTLIAASCNADGDSLPQIRQRLWETRKRQTYLLRYDTHERLIGYLDYDCAPDGIVHVRKLIALHPRLIWSMVRDLKTRLPWTRVYFYRAKHGWRHHAKPWSLRNAMA